MRAAIALAIAALNPVAAQQDRVQAGTLNCDISGGLGLIIGSQKDVTCLFVPADAIAAARSLYRHDHKVRARSRRHVRRPDGVGGLRANQS